MVSADEHCLILAPGLGCGYFGQGEYEPFAAELKSLAKVVTSRNTILHASKQAEAWRLCAVKNAVRGGLN